ncbi:MAG: hypothetical protein IBX56_07830, partial [Methylomicrobium sp.]|nr:hypothetical protein [Methylomicrobium sp.]
MASAEIIGLLCAGTTRYHEAGSSRCADRVSRSELAGLLAGADRGLMAMAFAKYAGDVEAEREAGMLRLAEAESAVSTARAEHAARKEEI